MKRTILAIGVIIILMLTSMPSFTAETTQSRTIYVDDDGGADYTNIQDAIIAADDGDTVFVYSGYYEEILYISKSISLIGENRQSTIIDGGGEYWIVFINNEDFRISGFTIQNSGKTLENSKSAGIMVHENNVTIENNYIIDNWGSGIFFKESENNIIENNILTNNGVGIRLDHIERTDVNKNYMSDNICGMYLFASNNNTITGNQLYHNGFDIRQSYHNDFSNNQVNEKPFVILRNAVNMTIDDAGQIYLYHCENITIRNLDLSLATIGIKLFYSNYCSVESTILNNNFYGIISSYSHNNFFDTNQIDNTIFFGLYFYDSDRNNIINNTIDYSQIVGVLLGYSDENTIQQNSIKSEIQKTGIEIQKSHSNEIVNNEIMYSNFSGITLFHNCTHTNIVGNKIELNDYNGIDIWNCSNTNIIDNTIIKNENGIRISTEKNLHINHNKIKDNGWGISGQSIVGWNVTNNLIENNSHVGILSTYSEGFIFKNIFKDNWVSESYLGKNQQMHIKENNFIDNKPNIHFVKPCNIIWDGNYWNNWPFSIPKPILGMGFLPIILIPSIGFPFPYPSIDYDRNPSTEPNDCGWDENGFSLKPNLHSIIAFDKLIKLDGKIIEKMEPYNIYPSEYRQELINDFDSNDVEHYMLCET